MADSNYPDDVNTVPAEDGTTWVEITSVGTQEDAELLAGFLETEGIPAQIENVKSDELPINFGMMGEIRVYVRSQDEPRAQEILRSREAAYDRLDEDGETLVTDEGPAVVDETSQQVTDDGADNNNNT